MRCLAGQPHLACRQKSRPFLFSALAVEANYVVAIPTSNFKAGEQRGNNLVMVMGSLFEHSLGLLCEVMIVHLQDVLNVGEGEMNWRHANLE
jgi:hypothetical protein